MLFHQKMEDLAHAQVISSKPLIKNIIFLKINIHIYLKN